MVTLSMKVPHHFQCSGLSEAEFDFASGKTKAALKWYCSLCNDHASDILSNFEKFKKMNNEIKTMKTKIDKKFLDFEVRSKKCEDIEKNPFISSTIEKVVNKKKSKSHRTKKKL